ncbi:MAG: phosphatidylserine decarboxylase [Campylobacterales bacterium]|nr:phosphatidylserine decarboxylase [Campylobacterales bacterium]
MTRHITNAISQQFGRFASKEFPQWFQKIVNQGYVSIMGLDMSEFYSPVTYRSLNALFTRRLKASRRFSNDADDLISPCDSLITECGDLDATRALQIKGISYCVRELLGSEVDDANKDRIEHGQFMNFYLSPRDYHRYHVPTNMKVLKAVHIPGKLYPVNMPSLNKRADLFIENERVVLECESWQGTLIYLVLVGALNVGKIQVSFEPRIQTNADAQQATAYTFNDLYLKKGDDFGCFEMGSTIVMIMEKAGMKLKVEAGQKVRFGDTIASIG